VSFAPLLTEATLKVLSALQQGSWILRDEIAAIAGIQPTDVPPILARLEFWDWIECSTTNEQGVTWSHVRLRATQQPQVAKAIDDWRPENVNARGIVEGWTLATSLPFFAGVWQGRHVYSPVDQGESKEADGGIVAPDPGDAS
jgi:hypothetical protein